jgi:lipoprotein-releasing system permease protein
MNGFDRELKNRVLGMVPQATVSSTQILTDWPELVKRVEHIRMLQVLHHLLNCKGC